MFNSHQSEMCANKARQQYTPMGLFFSFTHILQVSLKMNFNMQMSYTLMELVSRWLRCLHCCLTARRSWVRLPHGALLALGGRSPPDLQCSGGLGISRYLCLEFACSPSVHKNPN